MVGCKKWACREVEVLFWAGGDAPDFKAEDADDRERVKMEIQSPLILAYSLVEEL